MTINLPSLSQMPRSTFIARSKTPTRSRGKQQFGNDFDL
jgi:hypothetical protein